VRNTGIADAPYEGWVGLSQSSAPKAKKEAPPDGGHWAGLPWFLMGGTLVMGEGLAPSRHTNSTHCRRRWVNFSALETRRRP
jgi:hypothetical protein